MLISKKAWEIVQAARSKDRIKARNLITLLFSNFLELKGDYLSGEDKAIVGGIAFFDQIPVTVVAQHKGNDTTDRINHNFGMPMPEGFRKALRLMKQAEKFNRPIITIIDTPGAYPSDEAEKKGQARAISDNLFNIIDLNVPIISIVLGEGGSGGALALAISDKMIMFENSFFSVISPEGMASILHNDITRAEELSEAMKITPNDLLKLGIIDVIIEEEDINITINNLKKIILDYLKNLFIDKDKNQLINKRKNKYERKY